MTSVSPTKRMKLSQKENEFKKNSTAATESGFHSQIDFSGSAADFSLPPVKGKCLATRRASLQQISLNNTPDLMQQSSGYSSINISNEASTYLGRTSRTPKKRKSETSTSDENFYQSFHFVSPVKIPRRSKDVNEQVYAKKILKEKSSSANVILSSTPIRTNNAKNSKWGKFRSFHPEKFPITKSLDDDEPIEKPAVAYSSSAVQSQSSFSSSLLEYSDLSGSELITQDIPANLQKLWTEDIKASSSSKNITSSLEKSSQEDESPMPQLPVTYSGPSVLEFNDNDDVQPDVLSINSFRTVSFGPTESQEKIVQATSCSPSERKKFFNGRLKCDVLGMLYAKNDIAVERILSYLDEETFLSLSHVSSDYRHMITSNKICEQKRLNYLKTHRAIKENKQPSRQKSVDAENICEIIPTINHKKKALGDYNFTNIKKTFKNTTPSPPQSPSSRRFNAIQKIIQNDKKAVFKRCPRCRKPAIINKLKIRNSPRKRKSQDIYKLSISTTATGRVRKRTRATFLSKTSIQESFVEAVGPHYVTIDLSKSPDSSVSFESSNSSSSSDETCDSDDIYEYGYCTAVGCGFKFCFKCNCKYHPRRICAELSPPSPSRNNSNNNSKILAGTKASRKSLKRLINY